MGDRLVMVRRSARSAMRSAMSHIPNLGWLLGWFATLAAVGSCLSAESLINLLARPLRCLPSHPPTVHGVPPTVLTHAHCCACTSGCVCHPEPVGMGSNGTTVLECGRKIEVATSQRRNRVHADRACSGRARHPKIESDHPLRSGLNARRNPTAAQAPASQTGIDPGRWQGVQLAGRGGCRRPRRRQAPRRGLWPERVCTRSLRWMGDLAARALLASGAGALSGPHARPPQRT